MRCDVAGGSNLMGCESGVDITREMATCRPQASRREIKVSECEMR